MHCMAFAEASHCSQQLRAPPAVRHPVAPALRAAPSSAAQCTLDPLSSAGSQLPGCLRGTSALQSATRQQHVFRRTPVCGAQAHDAAVDRPRYFLECVCSGFKHKRMAARESNSKCFWSSSRHACFQVVHTSPLFGALCITFVPLYQRSLHGRRRVMLKVSGEALQGSVGFGIDPQVGSQIAAHHRACSTICRRFADTMCWNAKGAAGVSCRC